MLNETDNDGSVAPQRLEAIAIVYGVLDAAGATSSEVEKELFEKVVKATCLQIGVIFLYLLGCCPKIFNSHAIMP